MSVYICVAIAGHALLTALSRSLKALAQEFNLVLVATNHTVTFDGREKGAMGDSWSFVPDTRLSLSVVRIDTEAEGEAEGTGGSREQTVVTLSKSCKSPTGAVLLFDVHAGGVSAAPYA